MQQIMEVAPRSKGFYLFDNSEAHYKLIASLRRSGARSKQNIIINTPLPQWSKPIINDLVNR